MSGFLGSLIGRRKRETFEVSINVICAADHGNGFPQSTGSQPRFTTVARAQVPCADAQEQQRVREFLASEGDVSNVEVLAFEPGIVQYRWRVCDHTRAKRVTEVLRRRAMTEL